MAAGAALWLLIAGFTLWGLLAIRFQTEGIVRWAVLAAWCSASIAMLAWLAKPKWRDRARWPAIVFAISGLALLGGWLALRPSHDRIWADDVARLLRAEVEGSRVTLHNVRNFEWRSEDDYTARWETREYDLDRVASADLFLSYWMGPQIAHTLISFGFDDGRQVVFRWRSARSATKASRPSVASSANSSRYWSPLTSATSSAPAAMYEAKMCICTG
jgi:hypothetical protein